jgi:GT2 family glycosyltransferase
MILNNSASVTIVVVNFNQTRFVKDALTSIKSQTLSPEKVIVIDDGSDFSDVEKLRSLIDKTGIDAQNFVYDGRNIGITARLNQIMKKVESEWLIILAADDMLFSNSIEILLDSSTAEIDVVWGNLDLIDEDGKDLKFSRPRDTWQGSVARRYVESGLPFNDLLHYNNFIPGGMTLIRTSAVRAAGGWDQNVTTEDFDLWLRIGRVSWFKYIDKSVGCYRVVSGSKSRLDSHKIRDHALLLGKQTGESEKIDRGVAYLAAMRWAFTIFRSRNLPSTSLAEMAEKMNLSPWLLRAQLPRAIFIPIFGSIVARIRRLVSLIHHNR